MTGDPVRLLIASPDRAVVAGLRAMLARHSDRVVVVDAAAAGAPHVPGVDVFFLPDWRVIGLVPA